MVNRIQKIIDSYNLNSSQFAEIVGVQRSSISHILSGRNKPSLDFIMKILSKYPDIDPNWLIFGKGDMYIQEDLPQFVDEIKDIKERNVVEEKHTLDNENLKPNNIIHKGEKTEPEKDFIDIISNAFFNDSKNEADSQQNDNETLKQSNDTVIPETSIERVIIFYNNGKFKEYKPA